MNDGQNSLKVNNQKKSTTPDIFAILHSGLNFSAYLQFQKKTHMELNMYK